MGIDEIKPRQLAPSVGIGAADCAIVTVPTRSIYNSAATENHLLFGAFDFTAHSPDTMKNFEPVGDGLEILFGSFCFQVGQTGTLRLPERVPVPSIRPASWAPHPVLRTSPSTDEFYSSSSCNSDLCDPPSDEGTYGSGSESCGSSQPICRRFSAPQSSKPTRKRLTRRPTPTRRTETAKTVETAKTGKTGATSSNLAKKDGSKHAAPSQAK